MTGRKISILLSVLLVAFMLASCGTTIEENVSNTQNVTISMENTENMEQSEEQKAEQKEERTRIRMSFQGNEIILLLEDNSAGQDFASRLPFSVTFEDYNATEKIAYMNEPLNVSESTSSCTPVKGTFAFYIPWGNLSLFYEDFRESDQLVPLGEVEEGLQNIELLQDGMEVLIERMNQ